MDRALRNSLLLSILLIPLLSASVQADEAGDRYAVAAGHYSAQRWKLASEEFEILINKFPDFSQRDQALFYHAESLIQLRDFVKARERFREILDHHQQSRFIARSLFRSGEVAYLSNQLPIAKVDLRQFQQQYPKHELVPFAFTFLGEITLSQGEPVEAEQWFSQAIKQFPQNPLKLDCQLGLGRALDAQGKEKSAQEQYELVSALSGSVPSEALYRLGHLHYRAGRYDQADQAFTKLLSSKPTESLRNRAHFALGQVRFRQKRFAEAERHLRPLTQAEPPLAGDQVARAQYWLGLVYRAQENWDSAINSLRAAANGSENGSRIAAACFFAGDCLLRSGADGSAVQAFVEFEKGLSQSDDTDWADDCLLGKVRVAMAQGEHDKAVSLCRQFSERFHDSSLTPDIESYQATAFIKQEKFVEATKLLEGLVDRGQQPTTSNGGANAAFKPAPETLAQLSICYAHLGKFGQSREKYAVLQESGVTEEVILITTKHLAEVALAAGEQQWSRELFQRLANQDSPVKNSSPADSKDPPAQNTTAVDGLSGLAWAQLQDNDLRESAATFAQILDQHPNDPRAAEAALTRGQILERLGDLNPALAMYREVIERHTKSPLLPQALLHAARLHDRLEQDADAQEYYEKLVTAYPKFEQADAALYGWAWLLRERGDVAAANAKFRELRERFPQSKFHAEVTYILAENAAAENDHERALELLAEILAETAAGSATSESSPPAKDRSPEGTRDSSDAAATSSDSIVPRALYLKGRIALTREQWDLVSAPLSRLIRDYPQSELRLPAEYWIAEAAYRAGDFDKAEARLSELAGQSRGREDAWLAMIPLRRAQILAQREQWADGLALAESIEREFPNFRQQYEVDYLIGRCLTGLGRLVDARDVFRKVVRAGDGAKTETAAMAQWMIGETFMHAKNYEDARREYLRTEILYAYPEWQARALLQAGKCHEQQGEWRQAITVYSDLKKKYGETASVEEANRRLLVAKQRAEKIR